MLKVSVIIPAYNAASTIADAVLCAQGVGEVGEVIVVDDGSTDETAQIADSLGARVITMPGNQGKGMAMAEGIGHAQYPYILFMDADLRTTPLELFKLLRPVLTGEADVTVACPFRSQGGGFGLVVRLAGLAPRFGAIPLRYPLSGQRAGRRDIFKQMDYAQGFGVETSMNFQLARLGARVQEVDMEFGHDFTQRDVAGFYHRGKQFCHVLRALLKEMRRAKT
ncbi:MAG: glycosyltransferase family 2 protein [Limnochordia bacterium]|jgi:glycosyltransferase involved in cell wall biosynthesis|nr:glycosyltransferase family 2 protein [Limnochordia bacterium]MDD2630461.1 glycosyltransferase family 2 protein [Limnochordia bacterium]MDD4518487.1 glycosyltransferase family 2 protein [Limnochordia bacterium]